MCLRRGLRVTSCGGGLGKCFKLGTTVTSLDLELWAFFMSEIQVLVLYCGGYKEVFSYFQNTYFENFVLGFKHNFSYKITCSFCMEIQIVRAFNYKSSQSMTMYCNIYFRKLMLYLMLVVL